MRVRRVGSLTCGILLVLFGILFLLHMIVPAITFTIIFRLWPMILILLGLEMLLANRKAAEETIKYDTGAIVLVIILAFFAMSMGVVEICLEHGQAYIGW